MKLVSVVIPAFNAERFIGEAIDSVLAQTHHNLDVWVVDDGSTDGTAAVVTERCISDTRVRLLRQRNSGVSAARNTGARASRGTYIAFLDADDVWHPAKIERQVAIFAKGAANLGLVYCRCEEIDSASRVVARPDFPLTDGDAYAALVMFNFGGSGSAMIVPRTVYDEVGGFDISLSGAADWDFCLAVAERYDLGSDPDYLVGYRRVPGSMSTNSFKMLLSTELTLRRARRRHAQLPDRLFRWALGGCSRWLAEESRAAGRPIAATFLERRSAWLDPEGRQTSFANRLAEARSWPVHRYANSLPSRKPGWWYRLLGSP